MRWLWLIAFLLAGPVGAVPIVLAPGTTEQQHPQLQVGGGVPEFWFSFPAVAGDVFRFSSGSFAVASGRTVADVFTNPAGTGASLGHGEGGGSGGGGDVEGARWVVTVQAGATQTYYLRVASGPDASGVSGGSFALTYVRAGRVTRPTGAGRIRIIHNVVRAGLGEYATIKLAGGDPGGLVNLVLYTAAGIRMRDLPAVTLDGGGAGVAAFSPRSFSVSSGGASESVSTDPFKTGVYWVVASGAIRDRAPVMVVATAADLQ